MPDRHCPLLGVSIKLRFLLYIALYYPSLNLIIAHLCHDVNMPFENFTQRTQPATIEGSVGEAPDRRKDNLHTLLTKGELWYIIDG